MFEDGFNIPVIVTLPKMYSKFLRLIMPLATAPVLSPPLEKNKKMQS